MQQAHTTFRRGFTFIELILVMALLVAMIALSAPMLSSFFRGRTLDGEARRLLALTRAGQSRAVSEGFPVLLWVDAGLRAYGLEQETPPREGDPKAQEFALDESLRMEVAKSAPLPVRGKPLPSIRFLPDGTVDEVSPASVSLAGMDDAKLWLVLATNRVNYEIRNANP